MSGRPAPELQLARRRWPEFGVGRDGPLLLVPVGSLEQHGPGLPLATDTLVATHAAVAAAGRLTARGDRVLVAPAVSYGASGEHEDFPGTVSIGHDALRMLLVELARSACRWASGLIFVNGHGGNVEAVVEAVGLLREEGRPVAWSGCVVPDGDAHAGTTETSMLLVLAPGLVRGDLLAPGERAPIDQLMPRLRSHGVRAVSPSGVLGDPTTATPEEGRRMLALLVDRLVAELTAPEVDERGRLAQPVAAGVVTTLETPPDHRLPAGFGFRLARSTDVRDGGRTLLVGGGGVLRLAPPAAALVAGAPTTCTTPTASTVARVLLDRDAAVPWWPTPPPADAAVGDVTVVVPVRDRSGPLSRLLAALPPGVPVVVVDDGSRDPGATRRVAAEHGARCLLLGRNEGPAAARDHGLRAVGTPYVAFCDSDVTPEPGWLGTLRRHLDDPAVAVVAPRVLGEQATGGEGWIGRYERARSSLDLGPEPAAVRVRGGVAYLPAACLVARVSALGDGFDPRLRCGEDVDLVWRLLDSGWRVRYEPRAVVRHEHRSTLGPWLVRKAFYGTSAAPLAARHGAAVAPVVWAPWSLLLTGALLAQRRWSVPLAGVAATTTTVVLARRLATGEPPRPAWRAGARLTGSGVAATLWQTSSALTRHYWPLTALACTVSTRARRAVLLAAVAEGLADHRRVRPDLGPVRYVLARRLDDAAYGAGLWWGAWRARSPRALLPARARRAPDTATPPGR